MFYYLSGSVSEILQNSLVLDVNGVGYLLYSSLKTLGTLSKGQQAKLYISESIGESNYDLYGFADLQEKRFYELLLSVSGVGPKAAISLLSSMTPDLLLLAIVNDDAKALTNAPGIGKKTAQRIILELRDKLGAETQNILAASASGTTSPIPSPEGAAISDAIAALGMLGYSTAEITPVLRRIQSEGMSAEQIIRAVLKNMV
ncbi:MAG: Holliday junction branch migration protein RuvA [Oscillospiraceae bacterium]|nr:Holliday junction branch migration protein RuvA [Oscillospiraceae bacterium]